MIVATEPELIPLWPDGLPDNDIRHERPEETVNRDTDRNAHGFNRAVSSVSEPGLYVHPCDPASATGDVVLVCPGGGYHHVTIDKEGHDVATWLNTLGISAVVLKYRTRPEGVSKSRDLDDPILRAIESDGRQAMGTIRAEAASWGIRLERLGAMGFSAGSNMAIRMAMDDAGDPAARPDHLALLYSSVPPGASKAVSADWPPALVVHAQDDTTTPVHDILDLYQAYSRRGASAELHVYPEGGHAFGLGVRGGPVSDWPNRFADWINRI